MKIVRNLLKEFGGMVMIINEAKTVRNKYTLSLINNHINPHQNHHSPTISTLVEQSLILSYVAF